MGTERDNGYIHEPLRRPRSPSAQGVVMRLGGLHGAALRLHSLDFAPLAVQQAGADLDGVFTSYS